MYQTIPLINYIYLCLYISVTAVKFIYFMNCVNIAVLQFPFIFKNIELHRRALLSLKYVFVFSIHFFEYIPF